MTEVGTEFFRSLYEDDIFGKKSYRDTKITRIDIALDELIVEGKENFDLYSLKRKNGARISLYHIQKF